MELVRGPAPGREVTGRMNQYSIYDDRRGRLDAIKQGWSWPGFFLSWVWAMAKGMWGVGLGILALYIVFSAFISLDSLRLLGLLSLHIVCGIYGHPWREENLLTRGFECRGTETALNPVSALLLYTDENPKSIN